MPKLKDAHEILETHPLSNESGQVQPQVVIAIIQEIPSILTDCIMDTVILIKPIQGVSTYIRLLRQRFKSLMAL